MHKINRRNRLSTQDTPDKQTDHTGDKLNAQEKCTIHTGYIGEINETDRIR